MKKLLLILLFLVAFISYGQKELTKDTNFTCLPNNVARQILRDLNELDRLKKNEILYVDEIKEFEKKTITQDSTISKLEQRDKVNLEIIQSTEEKVKLIKEDNEILRKEIKRINIKTNIIEIVSGAIMATIIYIQLFK
jgi:replication-associated recombination protein RarA